MTTRPVTSITDEQLAEIERFLGFGCSMHRMAKDAERYRLLRDGSDWPAVFASHDAPEPLRGADLDTAMERHP